MAPATNAAKEGGWRTVIDDKVFALLTLPHELPVFVLVHDIVDIVLVGNLR